MSSSTKGDDRSATKRTSSVSNNNDKTSRGENHKGDRDRNSRSSTIGQTSSTSRRTHSRSPVHRSEEKGQEKATNHQEIQFNVDKTLEMMDLKEHKRRPSANRPQSRERGQGIEMPTFPGFPLLVRVKHPTTTAI